MSASEGLARVGKQGSCRQARVVSASKGRVGKQGSCRQARILQCTLVRNLRSLPTSCFTTLLTSKAMPPGRDPAVPPGEAFFLRGENMGARRQSTLQDLQQPNQNTKERKEGFMNTNTTCRRRYKGEEEGDNFCNTRVNKNCGV